MKTITLTVAQFNTFVKQIFDNEEFLLNVSIVGEVTNFKISGANAYFELKDENAMLSCVKFGANDLELKNGDRVTVFGRVNFYVKSGKLSFVVSRVEAFGMGALYQQFLMLKEKLQKEGLFDEIIKKQVPKFANKIGVVTSETGAVIRDIINVTRSKNPYTDIVVYSSKVQGQNAEDELCEGIRYFNTRDDIDLIIVARGGGSFEDLAPFNTEKIVREIYNSKKVVISAVGHETDFSLCDFASDLRVPTPSVAAEVAVFDYFETVENIKNTAKKCFEAICDLYDEDVKKVISTSLAIIDKQRLKIGVSSHNVEIVIKDIQNNINAIINQKIKDFELVKNQIENQSPLKILERGYVSVEKQKKRIFSVSQLEVGDKLDMNFADGFATVLVENKGERK